MKLVGYEGHRHAYAMGKEGVLVILRSKRHQAVSSAGTSGGDEKFDQRQKMD